MSGSDSTADSTQYMYCIESNAMMQPSVKNIFFSLCDLIAFLTKSKHDIDDDELGKCKVKRKKKVTETRKCKNIKRLSDWVLNGITEFSTYPSDLFDGSNGKKGKDVMEA